MLVWMYIYVKIQKGVSSNINLSLGEAILMAGSPIQSTSAKGTAT